VLVAGEFEAQDFVFVDECGTHTSLSPIYGYSPRGERLMLEVPRNRASNTTLLASLTAEGMGECLAVEGATTKVLFETYVERVLAPSLRAGEVVVMDNLSAHKGERVRELIEERAGLRTAIFAALLTRSESHRRSFRQDRSPPA
jgi:hypothetical protein